MGGGLRYFHAACRRLVFGALSAALLFPAPAGSVVPTILYEPDVKAYREAFALQSEGKIKAADKKIKEIKNDILMPYLLHQRYMGPHYVTKFSEIKEWLNKYNDTPIAKEIYDLGLKKGAAKELLRPKREAARNAEYSPEPAPANYEMIQHAASYNKLPKKERGDARYLLKQFSKHLKDDRPDKARGILEGANARKLFARDDYLRMQAYLALAYFFRGEDEMAILWAGAPSEKLDYHIADWTLGLAYWREGDYPHARRHFEKIAKNRMLPADVVSGAAYWAWRANGRVKRSERVNGEAYLEIAADYPKTFYGILAAKQLHEGLKINWDEPQFTLQHTREIVSWKGGLRALALLQLDMRREATAELRFLIATSDDTRDALVSAVIALSEIASMPGLSINLARLLPESRDGKRFIAPQYPILDIALASGWRIDKALVNAVIRQESRFDPGAKSWVGARGLLQIMPATASYITRDPTLRNKKRELLYDEEKNLEIGQMYIEYLLALPSVENSLVKMLLAYNAGPGNLARQENRILNPEDDPLFFIESVSIKESRIYIKRVMANFWIYRDRMGAPSESLDHLAKGEWPVYRPKDNYRPRLSEAERREFEAYLDMTKQEEIAAEEAAEERDGQAEL